MNKPVPKKKITDASFVKIAEIQVNKIIRAENRLAIIRAFAFPLLLIISGAAFIPLIKFFAPETGFYPLLQSGFMILIYIAAIIISYKNLTKIKSLNRNSAEKIFEKQYNLRELSPFSFINSRLLNGNPALWDIEISRLKALKLKPKLYFPSLGFKDKFLLTAIIIAAAIFSIDPQNSFNALKPDISAFFGGAPQNIVAWVENDNYENPTSPLDAKNNILKEDTIINIEAIGSNFAPKLKMGSYHSKMLKNGDKKYVSRIIVHKSGTLKLNYFGTKAKWQIKVLTPPRPQFTSKVEFVPVGTNSLAAAFSIKDKTAVQKAQLVLKGHFEGRKLVSTHEIDVKMFQSGKNNIIIDTAQSPLAGLDADAFIEIKNAKGAIARSNKVFLHVPEPDFNNPFAAAIAEIRLMILRETRNYKDISGNFGDIDNQAFNTGDFIDFAPKNIFNAYKLLSGLYNSQTLNIDPLFRVGMRYAMSVLETSQNTTDAHTSGAILWEIIKQSIDDNQDTRTKVSEAIQKLKQAIENGAGDDEIQELRQELNQAIAEHIQALAKQQGDEGDMEVEDNTNLNNQNLKQMMDDIEQNAKNGNSDDALKQLDELDEMMQNLSVTNQGSGENNDNGKGLSDLLNQQRDLMDKTESQQHQPQTHAQLSQKQEELRQKLNELKQGQGDMALDDAEQNMAAAAEALKHGDINQALLQQEQALKNMISSANKNSGTNDNGKDPLGRTNSAGNKNSDEANGKNADDGKQTKVPHSQDKNRVRDIIRQLREKLSNPDTDDKEQKYYEDLLKKK